MNLFIVESPTKAKTIQRYLGKGFLVRATFGHVKDLPPRELGVDEETLEAKYVYLKGKKKLMDSIKKLARDAHEIYIGTDPDREGEAIAYFVREDVYKVNKNVRRTVFYEITPYAIRESVEKAGELNMNMVHSQFARRILDRLIGYRVSPHLWRAFRNYKLSAGRVQSPALRLVVEREREIQSFKAKKYYYVKAILEKNGQTFTAVYDYRYENPSDAKLVAERIKDGVYAVLDVEKKDEKVSPPKPFITSSLQSEANAKLGFPAEKTQSIAQKLYEWGVITYPRTDSYRMNSAKAKEFMKHIESTFGKEYVGRLRKFREKPTSQGAHECIRPTSLRERKLSGDFGALFRLILSRTLASLMSAMLTEKIRVSIEVTSPSLKKPLLMEAKGLEVKFDGWSRVYPSDVKEEKLPDLEVGDILKLVKVFVEEKKTQPPPRYTEGSLVKALEKLGIGRPSTYATIVKTLKQRGYVHLYRRSLRPTDTAFMVVDYLMEHFPVLMDYGFTAYMEKALDEVEEGKRFWKDVVREFFGKVMSAVV
ncbi:type I DNA topoisomerase [Hydrogenivirga sp.]